MTGTYGQDWASYQDAAQSTAGLAFVIVKQTEGTGYINPKAAAQIAHARAAGVVVGHYHYPRMAADAATEADRFLAVAKPQPGDLLVLDWEGYDPANKTVPFARQIAYKVAFLKRLAATAPTHQHLVYCSVDYLNRDPDGQYGDGLWIATANKPAGQPGIAHAWLIHQYSTAGDIDHDYCPLTAEQLRTWAHAKENDMPITDADAAKIAKAVADLTEISPVSGKPIRAGAYWAYSDARQKQTLSRFDALDTAVKAQAAPALSDAQLTAIATKVAASPVLASAIAEQVAVKLAARLAQ